MINTAWSPNRICRGWNTSISPGYFYPGNTYYGELYTQNNPQEDWAEFNYGVTHLPYDYYGYWVNNRWYNYYGNDCSGFVSVCWKMPSRWTTLNFYDDANGAQNYCYSIGSTGSAQTAPLIKGDALNCCNSHILLFNYRLGSNAVVSMEQTPNTARMRIWYYSSLSSYQPIRRKRLIAAFVQFDNYPTIVNALDNFSVRHYFYISYENAPADLVFEIREQSSGAVLLSQKCSNIGDGYWYKTFYSSLPDLGYDYYVYFVAYLTPPNGNWDNRYCSVSTANNPTLVKTASCPAGIEVFRNSGSLSGTGANCTFSVNISGRHTVVMCGNNNADFDLYAKWDSPPTINSYDYRGYTTSSLEWFTIEGSGNLYIMVHSYSGSGNWLCNVVTGHPVNYYKPLGALSGSGSYQWWNVLGSGGDDKGWAYLSGPDNADFDLYIKWNSVATPSNYDARGISVLSQEICTYPGSGNFYMTAYSYSGSGICFLLGLIFTENKGANFISANDQNPKSGKMEIPDSYELFQNSPNPFRTTTTIRYVVPVYSSVTLKVYNQAGQLVRTLIDGRQKPGFYTTIWDGKNDSGKKLPDGVYFYTIRTPSFSVTKSMVLLN